MSAAGELVRQVRLRHGLDQRSLARRARTSQTQISRIERGETSPSVGTVERLLEVMGERLELRSAPGLRPNQPVRKLVHDYEQLSVEERIAQAAALSEALSALNES